MPNSQQTFAAARPKPYFLPEGLDWDSLSQPMQAVIQTVIEPAYRELVEMPNCALERAGGASVVFLLFAELIEQFALGEQFDMPGLAVKHDAKAREVDFGRHLKTVASKQAAIDALLRIRKFTAGLRIRSNS